MKATVQGFICYLLHLQKANLACTSYGCTLLPISKIGSISHCSKLVINAFMEGLKQVILPLVPPATSWNHNIVLTRLMGSQFEPLHPCPLQFLSWKVAFLLAITSLRCVDELQAFFLKEPFSQMHRYRLVIPTNPIFLPISSQSIELPVFTPSPVLRCRKLSIP